MDIFMWSHEDHLKYFTFGECKTITTICNKISNLVRFSFVTLLTLLIRKNYWSFQLALGKIFPPWGRTLNKRKKQERENLCLKVGFTYLLKWWITFLTIFFTHVEPKLSKSECYIVSWETDWIVDRKIYIIWEKNKKYTLIC